MYLEIEREFRKKSKIFRSRLLLVSSIIVLSLIYVIIFNRFAVENLLNYFNVDKILLLIFLGSLIFWIICYFYIFFYVAIKTEWKYMNFFKVDETKAVYLDLIHKSDIKILKDILKEHNINTRPKMQETIRHYQTLLPRKIASSNFLSILAFSISVLSLLFSDFVLASKENMREVFAIIIIIALGYCAVHMISKNYFKFLSKEDLYGRIEASLSEIFMNFYEKK